MYSSILKNYELFIILKVYNLVLCEIKKSRSMELAIILLLAFLGLALVVGVLILVVIIVLYYFKSQSQNIKKDGGEPTRQEINYGSYK